MAAVGKNSVVGSVSVRIKVKVKVKLPGLASRPPGGSGLQEFPDLSHMTAARSSALLTGRLCLQELSLVLILLEATSMGRTESMILFGIEPGIFRLEVQYLN